MCYILLLNFTFPQTSKCFKNMHILASGPELQIVSYIWICHFRRKKKRIRSFSFIAVKRVKLTAIDGRWSGEFNKGKWSFVLWYSQMILLCHVIASNNYYFEGNRILLQMLVYVTTIFLLSWLDNNMGKGLLYKKGSFSDLLSSF